MPNSSNPAQLVFAVLYGLIALPFLGIAGSFFREGSWIGGAIASLVALPFAWLPVSIVRSLRRSLVLEKLAADAMLRAVRGEDSGAVVLARWTYEPDEWAAYARRERAFRRRQSVGLSLLLAAILGGLAIVSGDPVFGAGVAVAVAALFLVARWLRAGAAFRAHRGAGRPEVIVGPGAILFNGRYQVLDDHQYDFGGVRYLESETPPIVEFTVTWATRRGRSSEQYRVPVPRGREAEARALAESFPYAPRVIPAAEPVLVG